MSKSRIKSGTDFLRGIAAGLKTAAVKPNIYGYQPHPKQIIAHSSSAQGLLFIGGNRSGKTTAGATESIWKARGQHPFKRVPPPPVGIRAIAVDFNNGIEKIVKPEIARWCPPSLLKGGSWTQSYDSELRTLNFENGSFIEFMSYDQDLDKFAGTSRHHIWFDEEPPHGIFVENKLRLIDVGGSYWITMTPVEGMTWVFDDVYIAARTDPNITVIEVDMRENPHLNTGEIDAILSGLSNDEREAREHGKFVQIGGLIYKHFDEKNIVEPVLPPKDWLHVASLDHGFNNPTAWLWAAVDKDGRIIVYDEHYESGKIVQYHALKVHQVNRLHGFEPAYYVGDPSIKNVDPLNASSVQLEYIDFGIPIVPGNNDVRAGVNRVARMLGDSEVKPQLFITKNCINLINELARYRWSTWASKRAIYDKNKKEEAHKKNDHACDALRYLIQSRPVLDDGTEIPESLGPMGASVAIPASGEYFDEGVHKVTKTVDQDFTLGSEY